MDIGWWILMEEGFVSKVRECLSIKDGDEAGQL